MRVLHVNKFLYRRGGAEGYLLDLADLQRAAGDTVAYFGMSHPENESPLPYAARFPSEVELEPAPSGVRPRAVAVGRMLWSPTSRRGLARVIDDFRPDVLHLHNIYHQLSPSVLAAARAAGVPCVLTMHDYKLACPSYQLLDRGRPCQACVTGGPLQAARRRCKDGSLSRSGLLAVESWLHRAVRRVRPGAALREPERVPGRRDAPRGRLPGPAAGGQPLRRPDRRRGQADARRRCRLRRAAGAGEGCRRADRGGRRAAGRGHRGHRR